MKRFLVRITHTKSNYAEPKLVGHLAIRYEDSILNNLLKLTPEGTEIYRSGYAEAKHYVVEEIGPVPTLTFDPDAVVKS